MLVSKAWKEARPQVSWLRLLPGKRGPGQRAESQEGQDAVIIKLSEIGEPVSDGDHQDEIRNDPPPHYCLYRSFVSQIAVNIVRGMFVVCIRAADVRS